MNVMTNRASRLLLRLCFLLALVCPSLVHAQATPPAWWTSRGVVNPLKSPDDYAILNLGQLKTMALRARDELNVVLPTAPGGATGAGTSIEALIGGWQASITGADDYAVANLGQLKTVAKPFWDRLIAEHRAVAYPWTGLGTDDYAMANLGQLKTVFNFDGDMDNDGMDDGWEIKWFTDLSANSADNPDGDDLDNLGESLVGRNPNVAGTIPGSASDVALEVFRP